MLNKDMILEDFKKNLDFGAYGVFKLNSLNFHLFMGQKKMVLYNKGKLAQTIFYKDIQFIEIIQVFSGGGIECGIIPTRPNSIVLGNELKIKLFLEEIVIPFDIDSENSIKINKENLEHITELFIRFSPETIIKYNYDPYFL